METVISHIWGKLRFQWKERNAILQGGKKDQQLDQEEKLVNKELAFLYAIQTKIQHREKESFWSNLKVHQKEPLCRKKYWLSLHLKNIHQSTKII